MIVLFNPKWPYDHLSFLFYSNDTCMRKSSYQPRKDKDSNLNKKRVNKGTLKNSNSNFKQRRSNDALFLKQHLQVVFTIMHTTSFLKPELVF